MENNKLIPNSTQIPNIILDLLWPKLPEAEGKCLLYICRRTFGFHKDEDRISFTQFISGIKTRDGKVLDNGTGLSRASVSSALKNLAHSEAIFIEKNSKGNIYRINLEMDVDKVVQILYQFRIQTAFGIKNRPKQVKLLNLQKKVPKEREIKVIASGSKEPSAHTQFITFFFENCKKTRGVKPVITAKDGMNLKRILSFNIVSEQELEQIALYYLSDRYYKKFAPSISTFLSAGILNGLVDSLKNRPTFWKEMDDYMVNIAQRQTIKSNDIANRLAAMKEAFLSKSRQFAGAHQNYD